MFETETELKARRPVLESFLKSAKGIVSVVNSRFVVSTVRLPEEAYGTMWETMVFALEEGRMNCRDRDCWRYETESESTEGHARMVAKWTALDASGAAATASYPDDPTIEV